MAGGLATALASLTAVVTTAKDHTNNEKHEKTTGYYYISDDETTTATPRNQGYLGFRFNASAAGSGRPWTSPRTWTASSSPTCMTTTPGR
jgi:hypothetical protein